MKKIFLFGFFILSLVILSFSSKINENIQKSNELVESIFPLVTTTIPKQLIGQLSLKQSTSNKDATDASSLGSGSLFPLKRVLLVTTSSMKSSHSKFIEELEKLVKINGSLKIKNVNQVDRIELYGEYLYDSIVLLLPESEKLAGPLRTQNLVSFVDSGRNLFIAASSNDVSDSIKEAAVESGLEFDSKGYQLHDYFHNEDGIAYTHAVNPNVIREKLNAPILYRGLTLSSTSNNPLIVPILKSEATGFSKRTGSVLKDSVKCTGGDCLLVAAIQGRNGARITFVASSDVLGDELLNGKVKDVSSGNLEFSRQLLQWSLGMRGILRFRNVNSHPEDEAVGKHMYTVFEQVLYSVIIEEYDGLKNVWIPYIANDIQLEFTMLDPYYRIPLKYFPENGTYTAHFQVPNKFGVFKFVIDYRREGYTPLVFETQQTVRPFRLDQYERFIPAAYPYYISMFSSMIGFFVLGFIVLYSSYDKKNQQKVKEE